MNKLKKTFVALSIFSVSVTGSLLIAKDNRNEVAVETSKMIKTSNSNKKIKQISNGNSISFALMNDGFSDRLFVWGKNNSGLFTTTDTSIESSNKPVEINFNLGNDIEIKQVETNYHNAGVIVNDGEQDHLFLWGRNNDGQIGNGIVGNVYPTPVDVDFGTSKNLELRDLNIGSDNVGVVANDGNKDYLYMWGYNNYGQIGNNSKENVVLPLSINVDGNAEGIEGQIIDLDLGYAHSGVVINNKGIDQVYMWGYNKYGQLGNSHSIDERLPTKINPDGGAEDIQGKVKFFSLNMHNSGLVINDGLKDHLYMWGNNAYGEIGDGSSGNRFAAVEINVDGNEQGIEENVTQFDLGSYFGGIVIDDGSKEHLYAWGRNSSFEVGNGNEQDKIFKPVEISIGDNINGIGGNIKDLSLGDNHSGLVVEELSGDTLYMWGNNTYGQLGNQNYGGEVKWAINIDLLNYMITKPMVQTLKVEPKSNKAVTISWDVLDLDNAITSIKVLDSNQVLYDMGNQTSGTAVINGLTSDTVYTDWKLEIKWGNDFVGYGTTFAKIDEFGTHLLNNKLLIWVIIPSIILLLLLILLIAFIARKNNKKVEYNVYQQIPPNYQPYEGNYLETNYGQNHYLEADNDNTSELSADYYEPHFQDYEQYDYEDLEQNDYDY